MPAPTQDVMSESSADKQDQNPSSSGKKDVSGRGMEEVMAENRRKSEEISSLKSSQTVMQERLDALEEKSKLTEREKEEKASLEAGVESIDSQVKRLRSDPTSKPWLHAAKEDARDTAAEVLWNSEVKKANEVLEDLFDEHGEKLKAKTLKEFGELLRPYGLKYQESVANGDMSLERRNKKAFKDYMADKSKHDEIAKKEEELKKKEARLSSVEDRGRMTRSVATKDEYQTLDSRGKISKAVDILTSSK